MKSKFSRYRDNVHVTIYLKRCNLYFWRVDSDLEVELRVSALFLREFLEWHYGHMHIKALLGFWEPYGKHPFPNSFYEPFDVLSHQYIKKK